MVWPGSTSITTFIYGVNHRRERVTCPRSSCRVWAGVWVGVWVGVWAGVWVDIPVGVPLDVPLDINDTAGEQTPSAGLRFT